MKAVVKKIGSIVAVELPPDVAAQFSQSTEAEIFLLRDGIYLLSAPGKICAEAKVEPLQNPRAAQAPGAKAQPKEAVQAQKPALLSQISAEEIAVAKKLCEIRFENRLVPQVEKLLNAAEKKALASLISKKLISGVKNQKYPKGVYNISDALYDGLRHVAGAQDAKKTPAPPINTVEHLKRLGYMMLDNENDAKNMMPTLQEAIKSDEVKGVRGFDKKYYVLLRSFYLEHEAALLALLEKMPRTAEGLAPELHLTAEGVRTLLVVLADSGEVIEKNKGIWMRA